MNCILLFGSDFVNKEKTLVQFSGRRKEQIDKVYKAGIGKELKVGLVNGLLGTGTIIQNDINKIELKISLSQQPPQPIPVILVLALCRPKSLKKAIEISTSLGIKKIFIIESWRVEKSFWNSPLINIENLMEHVYLGLEQAKDTILPQIQFRKRFKPFVEDELPEIIKGTRAFVAHPYNATQCPHKVSEPVTLAVGPEGGFIPYEVELLSKMGFIPISLGDRILRVEYAIPTLIGRLL